MEYVQPKTRNWFVTLSFLLVSVTTSGCAKIYHAVHYNPVSLAMHDHVKNYYQSGKTGRVIPKNRCYVPVEPPCYGYEPTCWTRWPADCPKCPLECEDEIVIEEHVVTPAPVADENAAGTNADEAATDTDAAESVIEPEQSQIDGSGLEPDYDDSSQTIRSPQSEQTGLDEQRSKMQVQQLVPVEPTAEIPAPADVPAEGDDAAETDEPAVAVTPSESVEDPSEPIEVPGISQPRSIFDSPKVTEPAKEILVPAPSDEDRQSSRRRRKFAVITPQGVSEGASAAMTAAEVNSADVFPMLATAEEDTQVARRSLPSFLIPARTASDRVAKKNDDSERAAGRTNATTVSFR